MLMKHVPALLLAALVSGCVTYSNRPAAELRVGMTKSEVHSGWGSPNRSAGDTKEYWQRDNSALEVTYDPEGRVVDYKWTGKSTH